MSWYIFYRAGVRDKNTNKIYPLGPFDYKGRYCTILTRSRTSHVYDNNEWKISKVDFKDLSDEFLKAINKSEDDSTWITEEKYGECGCYFDVIDYKDLGSSNYIKKGYVLIDDLEQSEKEDAYFDGFYEVLTPEIYAKKLENELKFGPPKPKKDCEGYDITPHSMSEYVYHCWPDYDSEEYETFCIKQAVEILLDDYPGLPKNLEPVLLIDQG